LPDPRGEDRVLVAISSGGVWETRDSGASWSVLGKGLVAPYVPPEQAEDSAVQDPHRVFRCAGAPDVMWMQHHAGIYRSTDAGGEWKRLALPCDDFGRRNRAGGNGVVCSSDERRCADASRWGVVRDPHKRRRRILGDHAPRAAAARRFMI
jgi:hypothetical protein